MDNKTRRGKDLMGMKFGELTVLGPAEGSHGKARCDCGRDVAVREEEG